jgi:hypothetical protein
LPILFEGGKNIGKCGKRIKTKEKGDIKLKTE